MFCLNERIQVTFMQMNIYNFLTCKKKWKMCSFRTSLSIYPVVRDFTLKQKHNHVKMIYKIYQSSHTVYTLTVNT